MKLAKIAAIAALSLTTSLSVAAPAAKQQPSGAAGFFNLGSINNTRALSAWLNSMRTNNNFQTLASLFSTNKSSIEKAAGTLAAQWQHGTRTKRFGSHLLVTDLKTGQVVHDSSDRHTGQFLQQLPEHAETRALLFVKADKDDVKPGDFVSKSATAQFSTSLTSAVNSPSNSRQTRAAIEHFVAQTNPKLLNKTSDDELLGVDAKTKRVVFDSAGGKHEGLFMTKMPNDANAAGMLLFNAAPGGVNNGHFAFTGEEAKELL